MTHTTQGNIIEAVEALKQGATVMLGGNKLVLTKHKSLLFKVLHTDFWTDLTDETALRDDYQITWPEPDWKGLCREAMRNVLDLQDAGTTKSLAIAAEALIQMLNKPEIQALLKDGEAE